MRAYPEQVLHQYNQAFSLKLQGKIQEALTQCESILKIHPTYSLALQLIGIIFAEVKNYPASLEYFTRAMKHDRKNAAIYSNRGNVYQDTKQYDLALADFDRAISIKRDFVEAHYNKGNCYKEMNQYEKAIECYKRTLVFNPKYKDAYTNMGTCYQNLQQFDKSVECYDKTIEINPQDWMAYNNKGYALHVLMNLDESIKTYDQAISSNPDNPDPKFNRGLVELLKGNWEKGWEGHEVRWTNRFSPVKFPKLWKGEDLTDKTIFIHHEQGIGDTIQFCRYLKLLKAKKIIVAVKPEAFALLKSMPEIDEIYDDLSKVNENDYHYQSPFMSLPYIFKTRPNNIPHDVPYLFAPEDRVAYWKDKLKDDKKFKVGLVWSGGFRADQPELWAVNNRRNVPLDKLASFQNENISFYSLQKGEFAEAELKNSKVWNMIDYTSELQDFSDTAALIENLDLIISVDTSTAHVAGALNKPVWMMNRFDTCWRWLTEGNKTDWYPSMTIYRQNSFNNWYNVINNIAIDLHALSRK